MELLEAFAARRSYRSYEPRPVDRALLQQLIDATQSAPVSCNLQLTQYVVIDDPKLLAELGKEASYKFNYAPACIVVVNDPRFTVEHHSSHLTAGMAVEHLLLRAVELGLATCPMAGFRKDDLIKKKLGIPPELELLLLIAVGYPKGSLPAPVPRLSPNEIFRFNSYDGLTRLNGSPRLEDYSVDEVIEYRSRISPVYLERFRLRTYSDSYYEKALAAFTKHVPVGSTVLDLMSYDGAFIKLLASERNPADITASDYLPNNLALYAKALGVRTARITPQNDLQADGPFDAISFIFQEEFTPELPALLENAVKKLRPGGLMFVASVREGFVRALLKRVRAAWHRTKTGAPYNVYEGNPFYRIGPRTNRIGMTQSAVAGEMQHIAKEVIVAAPGVNLEFNVFRKPATS